MKKEVTEKKKTYHMGQNVWFMTKLAWQSDEKKVLVLGTLSATLTVLQNLILLYAVPMILSAVEQQVSEKELLLTIAKFVIANILVSAASAYVKENLLFGRVTVRSEIVNMMNRKAATTSYPNLDNDAFRKLEAKSQECVASNQASTEAIWETLTTLLENIMGFCIYMSLLSTVEPFLMVVILVTTAISYFIRQKLNGYGYRHREEEAEYVRQMKYITTRARDVSAAKDIRIFGLRSWLEEVYKKTMDAYTAFQAKVQGVYLWAKVADVILSFLRNGIAYVYLIGLMLQNEMTVAQFLLYFSAISGFTSWVCGILDGFHTLYKQSLDISTVREFLEFEECFRFEDGKSIEIQPDHLYEIRLEHVSYRYPGADKDTLTDINLTLHPGEKLAVVGMNGAGKTTLIKLICGFLDPTEGCVRLDGTDIRIYDRADYYKMFSAVFQDFPFWLEPSQKTWHKRKMALIWNW